MALLSQPRTVRRLSAVRDAPVLSDLGHPGAVSAEAGDDLAERLPDVAAVQSALDGADYLCDLDLASALFCAVRLPQPLLLEGEPGVGKTEAAKALAAALDTPLIRLQCYEGIDAAEALYEWNYPRQLLGIRLAEATGADVGEDQLFGRGYLIERPLLQAIEHPGPRPAVLLVDEVDRADDEFEAFLFELLAEASVTIPELGTLRAAHPPVVLLTSNRTRDLHDALKRRCLYHWIDYPDAQRELAIVRRKCPNAPESLAREVVAFTQKLRTMDLFKSPGVAETLDWAEALLALDRIALDPATVADTIGALLKYQDDVGAITPEVAERLVAEAREGVRL